MSICFFESNGSEQFYLTQRLPEEKLHFRTAPLTTAEQAQEIADDAEIVSPFVRSRLGADVIANLPHLKMIATRSTGFDHIDVPEAMSRDIPVRNVPTYGENTVAEHKFALILALSRNLHKAYIRTVAGNFALDGRQGFDLVNQHVATPSVFNGLLGIPETNVRGRQFFDEGDIVVPRQFCKCRLQNWFVRPRLSEGAHVA